MPPRRAAAKENAASNASVATVLTLEVTAGPCKGTVFADQVERRRIGRVKGAGNNVCVKDPSVSQKHAELVWTGAAWELTDLGSSNGTFVNGKELQEGVAVALHDGDDVLFGESSMVKVHISAAAQQPSAAGAVAGSGLTVEQFLTEQCDALVQRLQTDMEREMSALRSEADIAIAELQRATAE